MDHGTNFRRRHQADIGLRCEGVDGGINIVGVANANRDWLYRRRTGDSFERVKKEFTRCGDLWSAEDKGHPCHARRDLLKQLQPFPSDGKFESGESGQISTGLGQAGDQTRANRIGKVDEYDWYGARLSLQYDCCRRRAGYDYIGCEADKLHCISSRAVGIAVRPTKFEVDIASFGPTKLLKTLL